MNSKANRKQKIKPIKLIFKHLYYLRSREGEAGKRVDTTSSSISFIVLLLQLLLSQQM